MPDSPRDLCEQLQHADKAATPGPWRSNDNGKGTIYAGNRGICSMWAVANPADAHLIALARTAAPVAAGHALALAGALDRLATLADKYPEILGFPVAVARAREALREFNQSKEE